MTNLTQWTLDRMVTKIQNDLELHAEIFIQPSDIKQFIYDAIDDAEELIVNSFSDFYLTFQDYTVDAGASSLVIPDDIYEVRIRGLYYDNNSYNQNTSGSLGNWYKIKKQSLETIANVDDNDLYQYRIINDSAGARIQVFPDIRNASTGRFRLWYIRHAVRPADDLDVIERGLRPQYLIAHAKESILAKENSDFLPVAQKARVVQTEKLVNSLSRLSDDEEDSYLNPDINSLFEAYGDGVDGLVGFGG